FIILSSVPVKILSNSIKKCQLPLDAGRCKASFHHFYFNAAIGNCEEFIYNGCGGNDNNFYTMAQCRTECQRSGKEEISNFASAHH
uniref:BPTI/Kunitz inhibitor domain-containing protein n=1 Tax=Laticauda laticaudata TaxID=8630 RepID=A0A8C5S8A1_LATLA